MHKKFQKPETELNNGGGGVEGGPFVLRYWTQKFQ